MKLKLETFIAALIIFYCVISRLLVLPLSTVHGDEYAFALVARGLLEGYFPHTYFFEHKPLGISLFVAIFFKIFGDNLFVFRLIPLIVLSISSYLIYLIVRANNLKYPILSAALYFLIMQGPTGEAFATDSEMVVNLFLLGFIYFSYIQGKALGYIFAGLASSVNYLAVPIVAMMILWNFLSGRFRSEKTSTFLYLVIGWLVHLTPFLAGGNIADYYSAQSRFLSAYGGLDYFRLKDFLKVVGTFYSHFIIFLVCSYFAFKDKRKTNCASGLIAISYVLQSRLMYYIAYFVTAMMVAMKPGPYWPHYFLLITPAVILMVSELQSKITPKLLGILILMVFSNIAKNSLAFNWFGFKTISSIYNEGVPDYIAKTANIIRYECMASKDDLVFVYSMRNQDQGLNYLSHTRPAIGPGWNQPFNFLGEALYQKTAPEILNEVLSEHPKSIVYPTLPNDLSDNLLNEIKNRIRDENYRAMKEGDLNIFCRVD